MKKLVSGVILLALLAALLIPSVSAADILFSDDFNSGEFNEDNWRVNGSAFYIEQGGPTNSPHLEGWAEAVVQQTSYIDSGGGNYTPSPRVYTGSFAVKCDAWVYGDGGKDQDSHWVALWWADHFDDRIGMDVDRIVYSVRVYIEDHKVVLLANGDNGGKENFEEETVLSEWEIPESEELEMDESSPSVFNIGMRINGTQIDGYFNNMKVVSATAPRMGSYVCPILYWNGGCWTGFDNFVVSTPDYDLFGEGTTPAVNPVDNTPSGGGANEPEPTEKVVETKVETKVVEDTDENGEIVTRIETEIVTEEVVRPAPDTGNAGGNQGGGTSARTGDAAIIVAAVMIAALGAAVVIKKIRLG